MIRDNYVQQCQQRMRVWMELRGLAPVTVSVYLRCARRFIEHIGRPLGSVKTKDVEQYLLALARRDCSPRTRNVNLAAIRCALRATLRRDPAAAVPRAKTPRLSPEILSGSEVTRLLEATTSLKYRAVFMLAYGAGLRVSELAALETTDLDRILPVHCFHVVFTLPCELHQLAESNRALVFDLLLKSAAESLLALGRDQKWFGQPAQLGVTTVLHTWARDLHFHPHAHCIVTGGGLALDGTAWVGAARDFLFPVQVLGALFRGKFLDGLERMRTRGLLRDHLDDRAARRRRARLYEQSWVVYAKRPFGGADQVYRYLGRYTHRVAISNSRLVSIDDNAVVFRTRGQDTATLSPVEFIRRFLQHRLPTGFVKIRHGGLLAPTNVNGRLARAKQLLSLDVSAGPAVLTDDSHRSEADTADLPWADLLLVLTGLDLKLCPACGCRAVVRLPLPPDCRGPPIDLRPN